MTAAQCKPKLVTFTGVDDWTDPVALVDLAAQYPVEFGVLMAHTPNRQWSNRYPKQRTVERLLGRGLRLSAHICGSAAREVLQLGRCGFDPLLTTFTRAQINTTTPNFTPGVLSEWKQSVGLVEPPILQSRNAHAFPPPTGESTWLYDASGGKGIEPAAWPNAQPADGFVGYAGGLSPYNVTRVLAAVGGHDHAYWLDLESGVRTGSAGDTRFDIQQCRLFCQAVFDDSPPPKPA